MEVSSVAPRTRVTVFLLILLTGGYVAFSAICPLVVVAGGGRSGGMRQCSVTAQVADSSLQIWQFFAGAFHAGGPACKVEGDPSRKFCRPAAAGDNNGTAPDTPHAGDGGAAAAPLVTFVIPTKKRATLERTLLSIREQTDPGWLAIVVCDGCSDDDGYSDPGVGAIMTGSSHSDDGGRVRVIKLERRIGQGSNSAGLVRNVGMAEVTTPWVGFVDDDDTVSPDYVRHLRADVHRHPLVKTVIFRMVGSNGFVLPPASHQVFLLSCVGISFALNMEMIRSNGLLFIPDAVEDFQMLLRVERVKPGVQMLLSSHVDYYVRMDPATAAAALAGGGAAAPISESLIVGCGG